MGVNCSADTVVVFDFETTGMSAHLGHRSIEIGAVKLVDGKVVDQFDCLMNPGTSIPWFIQNLTGITPAMVSRAAKSQQVMGEFFEFSKGFNLVAHNAAFDAKFLHAEFGRIKKTFSGEIGCSLLAARRVIDAPDYKLSGLVEHLGLFSTGHYHRALADAHACAQVWLYVLSFLCKKQNVNKLTFGQLQQLNRAPKIKASRIINSWVD